MKITRKIFEGIPITIYDNDDGKNKPLLFFFHGFCSDRDIGIMGRGEILANKGFTVVAIDAYLHGQRQISWFKELDYSQKQKEIINIIIHTAYDAKLLYNKYLKYLSNLIPKVYAFGVSMGAATAIFLATIMEELECIVSIVGSPSFCDFYQLKQQNMEWIKDDYYYQNLKYYKALDPLINYQRLVDKKIFFGNGINDNVVPYYYAEQFTKTINNPNVIFKNYDTDHTSTTEMLNDAYQFLERRK